MSRLGRNACASTTLIFAAATALGISPAPASADTPLHEPASISTEHPCQWSTHAQGGQCVTATTAPTAQEVFDFGSSMSFYCPTDHPYPYLGAFSANPIWRDTSIDGWAVPKAVSLNGQKVDHLSFQGTPPGYGTPERGWITVDGTPIWNTTFRVRGTYECSTDYPLMWRTSPHNNNSSGNGSL